MDVDEAVEVLGRFLRDMASARPELAGEWRRLEVDLDAEGVVRVTTDVGVGLAVFRPSSSSSIHTRDDSASRPAVHVDVAAMAEWLGIDDHRWCHGTVDTDCILRVLAEDAGRTTRAEPLSEVFATLAVDPERLLDELVRVRPPGVGPEFPATVSDGRGGWVGERQPTGRFVLVLYRLIRTPRPEEAPTPLDVLRSLLKEDQGPAAEALEAVGVSPRAARRILGIPPARAVEQGAMWPPQPNPREFSWPNDQRGSLPYVESPSPSAESTPSSFVWTSAAGNELELSAVRNGPIRLRARAGGEATVDFDAHTAEILARHLMDFHAQLEIERWEPVFQAEAGGRPKPAPPAAPV